MTGISDDHGRDERRTDVSMVLSVQLQLYKNNGRKRDKKRSLTNEMYFQCRWIDAAADAGMNGVLAACAR